MVSVIFGQAVKPISDYKLDGVLVLLKYQCVTVEVPKIIRDTIVFT